MKVARARQSAFSLVEAMVSVTIFVVLSAGLYAILQTGNVIFFRDSTSVVLQQQARNAMDRIVREVRASQASSVVMGREDTYRLVFSTPSRSNVQYYLDGQDLVREYPAGNKQRLASGIGELKFIKTGARLRIEVRAVKEAYGQEQSFLLVSKVGLRNE